MRIGIIGSGNMGRALGVRWAALGHEVMFGARRPEQAEAAAARAGHGALAGDNDAAAAFAETALWTMRETDAAAVLRTPSALDGKVVIDLNNREMAPVREGSWPERSIAEALQAALPAARVVKAFNTVAMETFDTSPAALRSAGAQTFLAADDDAAKAVVGGLAEALGFEPIYLGPLVRARLVEAMADVIRLVMIDAGRGARAHLHLTMLPPPDLATIGPRDPDRYA